MARSLVSDTTGMVKTQAGELSRELRGGMLTLAGVTSVLWGVEVLDLLLGRSLEAYGVVPRTTAGLVGSFSPRFYILASRT